MAAFVVLSSIYMAKIREQRFILASGFRGSQFIPAEKARQSRWQRLYTPWPYRKLKPGAEAYP